MSNSSKEKFPFISDIEESLFSAFLQERKMWVDFCDHISLDYFNNEDHTRIFKIFKVFFKKYKEFPSREQCIDIAKRKRYPKTIVKKVERIFSQELKLKEVQYLYDECAKFIKMNKIKNAILDGVEKLEAAEKLEDKSKSEDSILEIGNIINDATSWQHDVDLGTDYADAKPRLDALEILTTEVTSSPWPLVNQTVGGGAYAKELFLVASSSSVGKTIFLDNWARYAWTDLKKNVLSITLEISEVRKSQRMDAEMQDIIVSDVIYHKDNIVKYFEKNKFDKKLIIKEFPTASVNINHLKQFQYQLQLYTGFIPDVIFVDYLDIMNPIKKTRDTYEDQGQVGAELRGWGIELGIPIISATQLNRLARLVEIHELNEAYLADSWKKLMIADTIVFLHNTPEKRQRNIVDVKVGKARNGIKDQIFSLHVDYPKLKIIDPTRKVGKP